MDQLWVRGPADSERFWCLADFCWQDGGGLLVEQHQQIFLYKSFQAHYLLTISPALQNMKEEKGGAEIFSCFN